MNRFEYLKSFLCSLKFKSIVSLCIGEGEGVLTLTVLKVVIDKIFSLVSKTKIAQEFFKIFVGSFAKAYQKTENFATFLLLFF